MDPSQIDRRRGLLLGISDASLPIRNMVVPGIAGKIEQRILSTNMQGESTRLVKASIRWAADSVGHFSSSFDLIILSGSIQINEVLVKPLSFVRVIHNALIRDFSIDGPTTAIMCTEAPLKFLAKSPDSSSEVLFGHQYIEPVGTDFDSTYSYSLTPKSFPRQCWIQRWGNSAIQNPDIWLRRNAHEECFILRGPITINSMVGGDIVRFVYKAGGYYCFPPNVLNQSIETKVDSAALTIHISDANSRLEVGEIS